jgi:thioredoxin-related protein
MRLLTRALLLSALSPLACGCGAKPLAPAPPLVVENDPSENGVKVIGHSEAGAQAEPDPIYLVAKYDIERDPSQDVADAARKASATGKRILLQVGGEWCSWCHLLDEFVHTNQAISASLQSNFLVLKVNYSTENNNADFLSKFPAIPGYPHLFVLDSDGSFLHSQGTEELEEGRGYSEQAFLAFIDKWKRPS